MGKGGKIDIRKLLTLFDKKLAIELNRNTDQRDKNRLEREVILIQLDIVFDLKKIKDDNTAIEMIKVSGLLDKYEGR